MATIEVAKLLVVLEGDAKPLAKTLKDSEKQVSQFGKGVKQMGSGAKDIFTGLSNTVKLTASGFGSLVKSVTNNGRAFKRAGAAAGFMAGKLADSIKQTPAFQKATGIFDGMRGAVQKAGDTLWNKFSIPLYNTVGRLKSVGNIISKTVTPVLSGLGKVMLGAANIGGAALKGAMSGLGSVIKGVGGVVSNVAGKAFVSFSGGLQQIGNIAKGAALGGVAALSAGIVAAGTAIAGFVLEAAPIASIKGAFEGIAGEGADRLLAEFDKATGGMVAQRDIMTSYNKAAQLVNKDFADRLPDAMQYLGKVSAATGQDLGFLLDSLVTGTGRLSPMILDNLGIQVSLSEANEAYAASVGKSVDELTKAEQQTALTNQVMEKLAENTASMPDIVGSASGSMAALSATIQDAKDSIGMALLPILEQILPPLIAFGDTLLQAVLPAAQMVGEVVDRLAFNLGLGIEPARALQIALQAAVPPEIADFIMNIVNRLIEFKGQIIAARDTIMPFVEIVMQWLDSNVQIEAVLTAIGIAIASVVVPAFVSMLAAVLPVVATFALLVAGVQLVYNTFTETLPQMLEVWRNNFEMLQNIVNQIGWSGLGKKIVEGIINGIKSAGGGLIDTMKGLAQQAIAAAKGALGIKSPSRVAAQEIGKPLAQGVAQGVMDASTAPVQAMGALASHTVNNSRVSNYNLTVHSERAAPTIQQDFAFMQAKAGALT